VEEGAAATESMKAQAGALWQAVARFKLGDAPDTAAAQQACASAAAATEPVQARPAIAPARARADVPPLATLAREPQPSAGDPAAKGGWQTF